MRPIGFRAGRDGAVPNDVARMPTSFVCRLLFEQFRARGVATATRLGSGAMVVRSALTDVRSATPRLRTMSVVVPQAIVTSNAVTTMRGEPTFSGSAQTRGEILAASPPGASLPGSSTAPPCPSAESGGALVSGGANLAAAFVSVAPNAELAQHVRTTTARRLPRRRCRRTIDAARKSPFPPLSDQALALR
jgi:Protein of unknown function (DUF3313)